MEEHVCETNPPHIHGKCGNQIGDIVCHSCWDLEEVEVAEAAVACVVFSVRQTTSGESEAVGGGRARRFPIRRRLLRLLASAGEPPTISIFQPQQQPKKKEHTTTKNRSGTTSATMPTCQHATARTYATVASASTCWDCSPCKHPAADGLAQHVPPNLHRYPANPTTVWLHQPRQRTGRTEPNTHTTRRKGLAWLPGCGSAVVIV